MRYGECVLRHRLQRSAVHDPERQGDAAAAAGSQWLLPKREVDCHIGTVWVIENDLGTDASSKVSGMSMRTWPVQKLVDRYFAARVGSSMPVSEDCCIVPPIGFLHGGEHLLPSMQDTDDRISCAAQILGWMHIGRKAGGHSTHQRHGSARHMFQVAACACVAE